MVLFKIETTLIFDSIDRMSSYAVKKLAEVLEVDQEYVGLHIRTIEKTTDVDKLKCEVIYFQEKTPQLESKLQEASQKLKIFIKKRVQPVEVEVDLELTSTDCQYYQDKVLLDWTLNLANFMVHNQGSTVCCWAYASAKSLGMNFALKNPLLNPRECECSPMELVDYVIGVLELNENIDIYGTYGGHEACAFYYAQTFGISLLENYGVEIKESELEIIGEDDVRFENMRISRGPRIYAKDFQFYKPDTKDGFTLEYVTSLLSRGVLTGAMKLCCGGLFVAFKGDGVYVEGPHPKDHAYEMHVAVILKAGNKNGLDYLHIHNSYGPEWGIGGRGDLDLKLFISMCLVTPGIKKHWTGKEWA